MKDIKLNIKGFFIALILFSGFSCESLVEDINKNPNEIPIDEIDIGILLLKGIQLADVSLQLGHQTRIASMWSGQTKGLDLLYKNLYEYNYSSEESNPIWAFNYQGVIQQGRILIEQTKDLPAAKQYAGIVKVLEAHSMGTTANHFGSSPYSEAANPDIDDPKFDSQKEIFAQLQVLLNEAIDDLSNAPSSTIPEDLFLAGNSEKWIKVANSLKARYFILTGEYAQAAIFAAKGVLSASDALEFTPPNIGNDSYNLNYKMINERGGFWSFSGSYLDEILKGSRNNSKTNEQARLAFYSFDGASASKNKGFAAPDQKMTMVGMQETNLILAETAARAGNLEDAIGHLNKVRTFLASGDAFKILNTTDVLLYEAYEMADFEAGGIENLDSISIEKAILREVIEERYVSGFGQTMPYDDIRRLNKSDNDIMVKPPLNAPTPTGGYPQRYLIPQTELNANSNAPISKGIFEVTEVNQ